MLETSQTLPPTHAALITPIGSTQAVKDPFVFDAVKRWAAVEPDKIAIVAPGFSQTYAQLEIESNRLARTLRARGIQTGSRVAFVLPRGHATILLLLAILKAGACYVPIDSQSPPQRIRECLEDAAPALIITGGASAKFLEEIVDAVLLRDLMDEAETADPSPIPHEELALKGTDLAYMIFTSGTTGRPKGVPIAHESLSNFVDGNQVACIRVEHDDQVFQGFSPASDGHHEEVWPTFAAGATLVVATSTEVHSGPELGAFLRKYQVTIISCAPTLLSMVDGDVPSIKRILFGAEHCPMSLVERWAKPGREILNTYGPTEATVGATFGVCEPGKPITIGKPLPGYFCYVLDENQKQVAEGAEGELCIAGIGLSPGYYGRPELNASRFLPNPYAEEGKHNQTIYRTGDRVKVDGDGNIVWLGRIDSQVKIRGHRIELSEIESQVVAEPAIQSAVVVARQGDEDEKHLVALAVVREGMTLELGGFLERMREALPSYMVPQFVEVVEKIPVLPSGKVDRRACEVLHGMPLRIDREILPPTTETESMVLKIWRELFKTDEISCADDFFADLGGYSLMASRFISVIRSDYGFPSISVLDIYENPTIRSFATVIDRQTKSEAKTAEFHQVDPRRYVRAKNWQALGIFALYGIQGFFWLGPVVTAIYVSNHGVSDFNSLIIGLLLHAFSVPALLLMAIAVKWLVGGRFKEGSYPIWGRTFLRWWFVHRVIAMAPVAFITGTPLAAAYLRALGAKVGKDVFLESLDFDSPDLIEIGDHCSFENSSWLHAGEVSNGMLHLRRIQISNGCVVGVRSGVSGGGVMEEGSALMDLACASAGMTVPKDQEWVGTPARPTETRRLPLFDPKAQSTDAQRRWSGVAQTVLVAILAVLESLPFMSVAFSLYNNTDALISYALEPVYAVCMIAFACTQALLVKWLVLGRLKPGRYAFPGTGWLRKWFTDKHLELISSIIVPVYDSLFARPWCQALGMKCGGRCEIALPRRMPYDLVEMGEESFLASEVSIGMPIRRNGKIILEKTVVGNRVFLGNDSVVPQGVVIPDESLLGVLSVAPSTEQWGGKHDTAWLGSPAFRMPNRQVMDQFAIEQTYRPTKKMYIHRLLHEALRIALPGIFSLFVAAVFIESFVEIWDHFSISFAIVSIPALYLVASLIGAVIVFLSKLVLVGKYKPTIAPLWSPFVWRVETYSAIMHDFGVPLFMMPLIGTPYMSVLMRFFGAKVGHRAFINTTDFTETDLIHLGDDVAINANAPLQAHLFEDRVMKIGTIRVGDRSTVGVFSVILCDSEVKADAHIGHLSLVMKGETVPANTRWVGSPAQVDTSEA